MEKKYLKKDSDEFGTPPSIFDKLHEEFNFTIDAAASSDNHLLPHYWTKADNALLQCWAGQRVFCNPPYSRGNVERFVDKAYRETREGDCKLAVLLIPTHTERAWFHALKSQCEVRFFRKRIAFVGGASGARGNHMLLIFRSWRWCWY